MQGRLVPVRRPRPVGTIPPVQHADQRPVPLTAASRRRTLRAAVAVLVIALAAGLLTAPAAQAAPARVWLQRADPLSTDPLRLRVAAIGDDGFAAAFSGRVTVVVGRTRATVAVRSAGALQEVVVPTTALAAGPATASAELRVAGRTVRGTVRGIAELPPAVELRGFGCGAVTPTQRRIAWQVAALHGRPVAYPAWTPDERSFPAYVHTVRPGGITDSAGRPMTTKGTVVVRRGTAVVARIALPSAARRLLFSVPWSGAVKGAFRPGAYTATLTLTDAAGRTSTATRSVIVARSAAALCG